jgi:hypothetical protein
MLANEIRFKFFGRSDCMATFGQCDAWALQVALASASQIRQQAQPFNS